MGQDDSFDDDDFNKDVNDIIKERLENWKPPTELSSTESNETELKQDKKERESPQNPVENAGDTSQNNSSSETTDEKEESDESSDATNVEEKKPSETDLAEIELERRRQERRKLIIDVNKPHVVPPEPKSDPRFSEKILTNHTDIRTVAVGGDRQLTHIVSTVREVPQDKIKQLLIDGAALCERKNGRDLLKIGQYIQKIQNIQVFMRCLEDSAMMKAHEILGTATFEEREAWNKSRSKNRGDGKSKGPRKPKEAAEPKIKLPADLKKSIQMMVGAGFTEDMIRAKCEKLAVKDVEIQRILPQIYLYIKGLILERDKKN